MVQLISIHIPKTGGTSFYNVLKQIYGDQLSPSHKRKDVKDAKGKSQLYVDSIYGKLKVLHGHIYYHELKKIHKDSDAKVICWLRDPVDRVISNHRHFLKRNSHASPIHSNQHRVNESLLAYAQREETRNKVSRFLDGIALEDLFFIGFLESFNEDLEKLSKMLNWSAYDVPRMNVSNYDQKNISTNILNKIRELNQADCALYKQALRIHNNRSNL